MSVSETAAPQRRSFGLWFRSQLRNIAPFATLLCLVVFFSAASPSFLTTANFFNILNQVSITGIIAVGLTFVILCSEIDLSVAAIANVTGIVVAWFTLQESYVNIANVPLPGWVAVLFALAACFSLGLINAVGVTLIGIPSFIMTLAMMQIGDGISALLVRGQIAYAVPPIISTLGSGRFLGVPWIVIVAAIDAARRPHRADLHALRPLRLHGRRQPRGGGIFRRQRQARHRHGDGDRRGLLRHRRHARRRLFRLSAQQNEFTPYLLDAIAAVVVGGTSLFGGRGGIGNTIIGLFVLGVLNNGLDHVQIDPFLKVLIRGLILLIALIINVYAQRLRESAKAAG